MSLTPAIEKKDRKRGKEKEDRKAGRKEEEEKREKRKEGKGKQREKKRKERADQLISSRKKATSVCFTKFIFVQILQQSLLGTRMSLVRVVKGQEDNAGSEN